MTASGDPGMDTPLAPLPKPDDAPAPSRRGRKSARRTRPASPGSADTLWSATGAGLRYALRSWRVLLVVVLIQLALALTVVMPFWTAIAPHLDHHPHAAAMAGVPDAYDRALGWEAGMDPGIWRDVTSAEETTLKGLTAATFWIAVIAWLFGAVAAGGFLGTAVGGETRVTVGRFLHMGGKYFGRMLRVGLLFACAYYVAGRLIFEAWGLSVAPDDFQEASETAGWWGARLREAVFVLLFFWFRIAADLARADLVVYSRTGAFKAFFRGLWRALRLKPVLTALLVGLPAFLVLLALSLAAGALAGDGWVVLLLLFVVFQVAVLVRWASRAAVITGLAHIVERRG